MNKNQFSLSDTTPLSDKDKELIVDFQKKNEEENKKVMDSILEEENESLEETLQKLMQTAIQPLEDRVLVYPDPVARKTEGGIIKPDEVIKKERPAKGTVIAVGPGKGEPIILSVGDKIMYGRFAGTPIEEPVTKKEVLIMRPMDIFVKL